MRAFVLLWSLFSCCRGFKFLFYNPVNAGASYSHRLFIDKLSDLLADEGHEVVNYMPTMIDHEEGKVPRKSRVLEWRANETLASKSNFASNVWEMKTDLFEYLDLTTARWYAEAFGKLCDLQFADEKLIARLKSEKFDLGFSENFDPCGFALFRKLGIKFAPVFSTTPNNYQFSDLGIPAPQSFIPSWIGPFKNPATFKQRFLSEVAELYTYVIDELIRHPRIVARQGQGDYASILAESQVVFVNAEEYVDFARPISQKIIYVGGFGLDRLKKVKEDLETTDQINKAKSVVLIAFGAFVNSSTMPQKSKTAFIEAIKQFPETIFFWRYQTPEDGFGKGVSNLVLKKWVPQRQVLNHEKTRGFFSHCGMNSMSEAVYFGVPMICIPFYGDQFRNCKAGEQRGITLELPKEEITKEKLVDILNKVLNDNKYQKRSNELSRLIRAKPLSATQKFVKYSELAAEFDLHSVLDLPGRELNFIQFYNIDVKLALVALGLLVIFPAYCLLRLLFGLFASKKSTAKPKAKKQ